MLEFAVEHGGRGGERGPGFILPLLLLLLIGFVVAKLIRRRRGHAGWSHLGSPMQTLQDRFARGEIDREEFQHRKAVLVGAEVIPPAPQRSEAAPASSAPAFPEDAPAPQDSNECTEGS